MLSPARWTTASNPSSDSISTVPRSGSQRTSPGPLCGRRRHFTTCFFVVKNTIRARPTNPLEPDKRMFMPLSRGSAPIDYGPDGDDEKHQEDHEGRKDADQPGLPPPG